MCNRILPVTLILIASFNSFVSGQQVIELNNPSFEDKPRKGGGYPIPIKGWEDCGLLQFPGESPPDIHPVPSSAWKVTMPPFDGNTYIGLVTRNSNTYESVSQKLSEPLLAGKCYELSVFLAASEEYVSATQQSRLVYDKKTGTRIIQTENFIKPAELYVWGGRNFCNQHQVLAHSGPVSNNIWTKYTLTFSPETDMQYLTFGAYYEQIYQEPYNGHILMDHLSLIKEIECVPAKKE